MESSDIRAVTTPNKRIGQALRNLLCGARPYVSIGWLWAICFYCVALGHMFLLACCWRGARPYVSIMWRWAICLYCMCGPYVFIGDCYESYHMFSLTMDPSTSHVIKYYKRILVIG